MIPLLKTGNARLLKNYRPISNLSSITKIFERLVLIRLKMIERRENCDMTGESQHGFKEKRSTDTAGLEIQSRIATECDLNKYVAVVSLDMSAAFDVVNHGLLEKRMKIMGIPSQLITVIMCWLSGRSFYCELNGEVSRNHNIMEGSVQGSILGPVLFAIYMSPINEIISGLVTFADDNYQISVGLTEQEALDGCCYQANKMIKWIEASGLVINQEKTEVCLFHRNDIKVRTINIGANAIQVKQHIKILGVIFDSKLTWFNQVDNALASANKAKQALSLIARFFNSDELLKLSTAYFYSRLYFGAKIWLISTLSGALKKKLWQASSRMLKIVDKDFRSEQSFMNLHKKYKRATPEMWGNYCTACAMFSLITYQIPFFISPLLTLNLLHNDRHLGIRLTRSNRTKLGFNCLSNRLQKVSAMLNLNWLDFTVDRYKSTCKKLLIEDALRLW